MRGHFFLLSLLGTMILHAQDSIVYVSPKLQLHRVAPNVYQHISWLQTQSWGKVDCNGMIVVADGQAVVFDTSVDDSSSRELIKVLADSLAVTVTAVVATHFHDDCVGGLAAFNAAGIKSWSSEKTMGYLKKANASVLPTNTFTGQYYFRKGESALEVWFPGEGHTRDNVVAWYPKEAVLFGGCLVKAVDSGKGNLADANEKAWSKTISRVLKRYPSVELVIPGHGKRGGRELLEYTGKLFKQ